VEPSYRIFVGYFSKNHGKKKIAVNLLHLVSHVVTISVHATPCGVSGQVYYSCLGFAQQSHADKAMKLLKKSRYHGMSLVIRPWVERTAANERRVANWRDQQWPGP